MPTGEAVLYDQNVTRRDAHAKKEGVIRIEVINVERQRFLFFTPRDVLAFPRVAVLLRRPFAPFRFEGTVDST